MMGQKMSGRLRRRLERMGYATTPKHVYVEQDGKMTIQDPQTVVVKTITVEIITKDASGTHHKGTAQLRTYANEKNSLHDHTVPGEVEEVLYSRWPWQKKLEISGGYVSKMEDPTRPTSQDTGFTVAFDMQRQLAMQTQLASMTWTQQANADYIAALNAEYLKGTNILNAQR